jgi:predicted nucleic acid-binding protein
VILVDTSAWIEFDRKTGSPVNERLRHLIADDAEIAVTEPVIMEVLVGAHNDEREAALRRLLNRFELLSFDSVVDFDNAVGIYRRCRQAGIPPRGMLDCMIAAVAIRHSVPMLARDADMARISTVLPLQLDHASHRSV